MIGKKEKKKEEDKLIVNVHECFPLKENNKLSGTFPQLKRSIAIDKH
jgi:hypothetical protein